MSDLIDGEEDIVVVPIETYVDFVKFIDKVNGELCNNSYAYRGQSNKAFNLTPSVFREDYIKHEDYFLKESLRILPEYYKNHNSVAEKLTKLQHYGTPTRLLDVTYNPAVALYFACSGNGSEDGELFIFEEEEKYITAQEVITNASLAEMNYQFRISDMKECLRRNYNIEYSNNALVDTITKEYLLKADFKNERIIRQAGGFLLLGIPEHQLTFASDVDEEIIIVKGVSNLKGKTIAKRNERYIIPYDCKQTLLSSLKQYGIDKGFLFPDPDNLAVYLKENIDEQKNKDEDINNATIKIRYEKDKDNTNKNTSKLLEQSVSDGCNGYGKDIEQFIEYVKEQFDIYKTSSFEAEDLEKFMQLYLKEYSLSIDWVLRESIKSNIKREIKRYIRRKEE